jgi:hypothetical protein
MELKRPKKKQGRLLPPASPEPSGRLSINSKHLDHFPAGEWKAILQSDNPNRLMG